MISEVKRQEVEDMIKVRLDRALPDGDDDTIKYYKREQNKKLAEELSWLFFEMFEKLS